MSVYLYTGPEAGMRTDAVLAIKESMKKKFGQVEEYLFYAYETPPSEYIAILESESLFSSSTCVVVKGAEAIKKKDEVDSLLKWISLSASDAAVLILVSDEISVDSKIEKAIPQGNKKIFWEMSEDKTISWLNNYFFKNGYKITEEAASLIFDMLENNTETLKNECSRFFICFPKGHTIDSDDVDAILTHNREENAFSLFNTMSEEGEDPSRCLEKSLEILQKIRLSKDSSSVLIIAGLASCFRKLIIWQKLAASGKIDDFNLKINGFSSKKMKAQYGRAARIWSQGQSLAILALLSSTDIDLRSGGALLEDVILQKMLYEIILKKGGRSATVFNDGI
ncbi:MAG: DNA polymerase III subunit delta [Treponema sp.]|nr:DNA polymerase III subunit delta [Treponema sp.]